MIFILNYDSVDTNVKKSNHNKPNGLFPYTKIDGYFYIQDKNFVAVRYIQRGIIY